MSDNPLAVVARLQLPSQDELTSSAQAALDMATGYEIDNDVTYQLAGEELVSVKAKAKRLEEQRTAITKPMNDALRAVNALFRPPSDRLSEAERVLKRAMIEYTGRIAATAREAEREAERQAQLAAPRPGEEIDADASIDAAVSAVASAPVVQIAPKAAGISKVRETHKARVVDKGEFLRFIAAQPALHGLVDVNESGLNALAKAMGDNLNYPGVEVYTDKSISARAA